MMLTVYLFGREVFCVSSRRGLDRAPDPAEPAPSTTPEPREQPMPRYDPASTTADRVDAGFGFGARVDWAGQPVYE